MEQQAYNIAQAARALGIDRSTLWRRMKDGSAPPHFRIGRRVLFPVGQMTQWMEGKTCENQPAA